MVAGPARQEMILILLDIGIPVQRNAGKWQHGLGSNLWTDVAKPHQWKMMKQWN